MAYYAALVQVVQLLEDIISHYDHVRFLDFDELGKHQITKSLHEKFIIVQKSLEGYSSSNGDHKASDDLERRIRDAAYRAQDIIESRISEVKKTKEPHTLNKSLYKPIHVKNPQHRPDDQEITYHQGLQRVEEEVDSILDKLAMIKESYIKVKDFVDIGSGSKQATLARSTTIVGFDKHLLAIKEQLCGGSSQLQTIPITGMGGIGKTTLARNIFDDKLIVEKFYIRVWITVSQDYRVEKMLRAILDSIKAITQESIADIHKPLIKTINMLRANLEATGAVTQESPHFTQLSVDIHKQLISRRYLIIVDDVWSTNVLDDINRISPNDDNGSRIMITTRLANVAAYASNSGSPLHYIQSLNEEQSWHLLREKVFAHEEERVCPPELEDIGKSIARNCRGLPLAIVVIAGVLSKVKRTRGDWYKIASNVNSVVAENDENFSRIFSLSYNHLPHHLKPCFLYIGGFPENHYIQVSKLIKLWMAEGFLNNNNTRVLVEESLSCKRRSLEEVGEGYLEDLVKRNLIMITKKSIDNGKIEVCCGMHDLLRDLCQQRCRNENFFHFTDKYGKFPKDRENNVRRACIYPYSNKDSSSTLITIRIPNSTARSILCFGDYQMKGMRNMSSGCFKLLRVFDALQITYYSFPDVLLELFHLRYLALYLKPKSSTTKLIEISPSISKLQNLQTFIVKAEYNVDMLALPSEMWKMAQLRHVMIERLKMPLPPPVEVGLLLPLENLQTLEGLVNFRFTEEAVAMFSNLKILKVSYTERDKAKWESLNNLFHLRRLEELEIDVGYRTGDFPTNNSTSGFVFPQSLKKLYLSRFKIPWKMISSVVGCLPNLEVLEIKTGWSMIGSSEEWETKQGDFQSLKFLLIHGNYLIYWRADETHFPRLVHLELSNCSKLEEIPLGIGDIQTLQFIEVVRCGKRVEESARLIQQQQEDMGNDTLHIRIIE